MSGIREAGLCLVFPPLYPNWQLGASPPNYWGQVINPVHNQPLPTLDQLQVQALTQLQYTVRCTHPWSIPLPQPQNITPSKTHSKRPTEVLPKTSMCLRFLCKTKTPRKRLSKYVSLGDIGIPRRGIKYPRGPKYIINTWGAKHLKGAQVPKGEGGLGELSHPVHTASTLNLHTTLLATIIRKFPNHFHQR